MPLSLSAYRIYIGYMFYTYSIVKWHLSHSIRSNGWSQTRSGRLPGGGGGVLSTLHNWYNPDNVTITSGYVSAWPDQMNNYNLSNVAVGGTGNTMTKVVASGTTSNVIYQSNIGSPMTNWSYVYGSTSNYTKTIYAVLFCCNTTAVNGGFDEIFGDKSLGVSIRFTVGTTTLNNGDLNYNGSTYVNGTSVQSTNTVTLPSSSSLPSGYTIYCMYITGGMRTGITTLCLLGDYATNNRGFTGYAGDFFVGNASFGTSNQQQIEGYLGYKYKCQSKLPTNHPYYSATNSIVVTIP